jgi:hypothetical protein
VKKVLVLGPVPQWSTPLPRLILTKFWGAVPRRTTAGLKDDTLEFEDEFQLEMTSPESAAVATYFSVFDVFCNEEGCLTYLGDDVKRGVTTWDRGHLTPIASDYLARNGLIQAVVE